MEIIILSLGIVGIVFMVMSLILVATDVVETNVSFGMLITGIALLFIALIITGVHLATSEDNQDAKYIHTNDGDLKIQEYEKAEDGYKVILEDGTILYLSEIILIDCPEECPFSHDENNLSQNKYIHTEYGDLEITEYEKVEDGYEVVLPDGTKIILDSIVFIDNPNECPFEHQ